MEVLNNQVSHLDKDNLQETTKGKEAATLPPCLVCGDVSSGLHFGAVTCEACTVFFRRSLERQSAFICSRSGTCNVNIKNRSCCSHCRLQKCISVGMSKQSCKRGRRSKQQKHNFKKMEIEAISKSEDARRQEMLRTELIEDTIQRLKKVHGEFQLVTPEALEKIQRGKAERKVLQEAMEDFSSRLPPEEIEEFYRETGIDLSGVMIDVIPCARECTKKYALAYVEFSKGIKEFMDLSRSDRVFTLQSASIIWNMVSFTEMWDFQDHTISCLICGACFTREHIQVCERIGMPVGVFESVKKLQDQQLTEDETAIFRTFVMFDTSQIDADLEEPEKMSEIQEVLSDCLMHTLIKNRGKKGATRTFAKLVDFIVDTRLCLYEKKKRLEYCLAYDLRGEVNFAKIAAEVFCLPKLFVHDIGQEFMNIRFES